MLDHANETLEQWLKGEVPKVPVRFGPPEDGGKESALEVYLYEVAAAPPGRAASGVRPPVQVAVRYLISASGGNEAAQHTMLGAALAAALDTNEFEVAYMSAATFVQTFGLQPRPVFTVSFIVRKDRPEPAVELVRQPIQLRTTALRSVIGRVYGPNRVPLARARVQIPSLRASANTDDHGCFRFAALPTTSLPKSVLVFARGREFTVDADLTSENPVDLTVPFPEE